jgi:hypothetical protein
MHAVDAPPFNFEPGCLGRVKRRVGALLEHTVEALHRYARRWQIIVRIWRPQPSRAQQKP